MDDQVGDATYGQAVGRVELKSHICRCVVVKPSHMPKYRDASTGYRRRDSEVGPVRNDYANTAETPHSDQGTELL